LSLRRIGDAVRLLGRGSARSIRTRPAYSIAVVVTFGLASAVGGSLILMAKALSPSLPGVPYPSEVLTVRFVDNTDTPVAGVAGGDALALTAACRDCAAVFGFAPFRPVVSSRAAPRPIFGELVTSKYFGGLRITALRGSLVWPDSSDSVPGLPVAVVSQRLWSSMFANAPDLASASLDINGTLFQVVGVAPATFRGLWAPEVLQTDVWIPVGSALLADARPGSDRLPALAWHVRTTAPRLAGDQLLAGAQAAWPGEGVTNVRLTSTMAATDGAPGPRGVFRVASRILRLAAVVLVTTLLVGLGALLLARLRERAHEFAVRVALGASTFATVGTAATELVLLAVLGTMAGIPLALLVPMLARRHGQAAANGVETSAPALDVFSVLAPLFVCAMLLGLALIVLWRGLRRLNPERVLRQESPVGAIARGSRMRAERVLLSLQAVTCVAMTVLGSTAALNVRAARSAPAVERLGDLTAVSLLHRDSGTSDADPQAVRDHVRRVSSALGVAVGLSDRIPFGLGGAAPVNATLMSHTNGRRSIRLVRSRVSQDYLRMLAVRPLAGRVLDDEDAERAAATIMLNESAVKGLNLTPSEAVGLVVRLGNGGSTSDEDVEALVAGVFHDGIDGQNGPAALAPFTTVPVQAFAVLPRSASFDTVQEARRLLASRKGPALQVLDVRTLREVLTNRLAVLDVVALWAVAIAVLGMCVSGTALTGLLQFSVRQRHRELAIRLTLGMQRGQLYRTALALGTIPLLVGAVAGIGLGTAIVRLAGNHVPPGAHLVAVVVVTAIAVTAAIPTIFSLRRELGSGAVAAVLKGG
jgi:ABC-type antimicrobial peptide transport system permease subunit